ncbi:MAG TPA: hypothetical protein VIL86_07725 [Tepidisphaeraceae bacterium]|jgi:hypothetical protein
MAKKSGKGMMGWLGRQVGHVKKAIATDVEQKVVYRKDQVREEALPDRPNVKLRRTVVDEVIVEKKQIRSSDRKSK